MRDSFNRGARTTAPPTRIWEILHDVDLLASFSSHLGPVTPVEHGRSWSVPLQDRVGPLKLSAPMQVEIVEETPELEVAIRASGQDRGPGTKLDVEAVVRLDPADEGTDLSLTGSFALKGRVAMLGASVARRQADKMIDEFWSNLTRALEA
jgi:carbon monoxide dehydrogenase subunit G